MIPLNFLYYKYIDRPKLSEQKNPFEYIVPPSPQVVSEQKKTQLMQRVAIEWRKNCFDFTVI